MSNRAFVQIAYFVPDVRAAAEHWSRQRGAGPFIVLENIPLTSVFYRGSPAELDHSSAYGQLGEVMVELVQQNNPGPSAFRDMFPAGQTGLHHMAQFADDLESELDYYQKQGFEIALTAKAGELPFAFVDTSETLGHMVELYQDCDAIRGFYAMIAELANTAAPGQVFADLPAGDR
jgi:hypothetical protein